MKTKIEKKTVKRLCSYILKGNQLTLVFVFFAIVASSLVSVINSLFTKVLIDSYIMPMIKTKSLDFSPLAKALCFMAAIYLVGVFSTWFYSRKMGVLAQKILNKIRNQMFDHMQKLPVEYFDNTAYGDIMSHYTNDTDTLRSMIDSSIPQFMSSIMTVIVVSISMLKLSWHLTAFIIIGIFLMGKVAKKIGNTAGKYFGKKMNSLGKVNGYLEEMITGQKVVKVFGYEQRAMERFKDYNEKLFEDSKKAGSLATSMMPIMMNMSNLQYVLVAVIGTIMAIYNIDNLTVGAVASFLQLTKGISHPIISLSGQLNEVAMATAGAGRIFDFLDKPQEDYSGKYTLVRLKDRQSFQETEDKDGVLYWKKEDNGKLSYKAFVGDIRFENVYFSYDGKKDVLKNINLYANKGQTVALVGATGAGKTTVTNLINRFYDIERGTIFYDGIDIREIDKNSLRKTLGIVLQDTHLFTGTVSENIAYGNQKASKEDIVNAAKDAHAHDFIMMLPKGYETILTSDANKLSQGQRQLLSIARVQVSGLPVLILDEATSSIDTRTEELLQKAMNKLMENSTVFVIAHRLSTIKNADVIMMLEHGEIIERGSHEELMNKKGRYYELYTGNIQLD